MSRFRVQSTGASVVIPLLLSLDLTASHPMAQKTIYRCQWAGAISQKNSIAAQNYLDYHDREWGVPVHDDRKQFEFLILEGAQAGLSWSTVLNRRDGYRTAFAQFDPHQVARFTANKIERLLSDPGIIRNRLKVNAAVTNARAFLAIQDEFGSFDQYIWQFVDGRPIQNHWRKMKDVPATTDASDRLSKDLKRRGFKFVGSTIIYAHMQATGMVNDHTTDCFRHQECARLA